MAALNICLMALGEGGIFVAKIFKGREYYIYLLGSDVKLLYS